MRNVLEANPVAVGIMLSFLSTAEPLPLQVNYNLMTVNIAMAATGLYQLYRKVSYDLQTKPSLEARPASLEAGTGQQSGSQ